jgi:endonuclease-3 related protein
LRTALLNLYDRLYSRFGPQRWWPADTPFEVIIGAILTQNTAWPNVEKAIQNLKKHRLLSPKALSKATPSKIAALIRPSGYYNIKTKRLGSFLSFLNRAYKGSISTMSRSEPLALRKALLEVKGIGPETADSILLYALGKPFFVIDAYTRRIFERHKLVKKGISYEELQRFFMKNLPKSAKLYNEYHALIVRVGKEYCKKRPSCGLCPLNEG